LNPALPQDGRLLREGGDNPGLALREGIGIFETEAALRGGLVLFLEMDIQQLDGFAQGFGSQRIVPLFSRAGFQILAGGKKNQLAGIGDGAWAKAQASELIAQGPGGSDALGIDLVGLGLAGAPAPRAPKPPTRAPTPTTKPKPAAAAAAPGKDNPSSNPPAKPRPATSRLAAPRVDRKYQRRYPEKSMAPPYFEAFAPTMAL
jgi:hypothetical protein